MFKVALAALLMSVLAGCITPDGPYSQTATNATTPPAPVRVARNTSSGGVSQSAPAPTPAPIMLGAAY